MRLNLVSRRETAKYKEKHNNVMHLKNASIRCYGPRSMVKAANGLIEGDRRRIAKIIAIIQYKMYAGTLQQCSSHNKVPCIPTYSL